MFQSEPDAQNVAENPWLVGVGVLMLLFTLSVLSSAALSALASGTVGFATPTPSLPPNEGGAEDVTPISTPTVAILPSPTPSRINLLVSAISLDVGDCFNAPRLDAEGFVETVTLVDCAGGHDREVFASFIFPEPADGAFPERAGFESFSLPSCLTAFDPYVGRPAAESLFGLYALKPTRGAWNAGNRKILCVLYQTGTKITGSARGTGR